MLSELTFGSFLVYSPRRQGEVSLRSRGIVRSIKTDGPGPGSERMIEYAVRRLVEELDHDARCLGPLFCEKPLLVPIPPSAPVLPGGLWVPRRICEALLAAARVVSFATPGCEVAAFALVRTMGFAPDVDRIVDPCLGRISLTGDPPEAHREP